MEEEIIRQDRTLSVVVPAYNEEMTLDKAAATIHRILEEARIPHELIFVDDGSPTAPGAASIWPLSISNAFGDCASPGTSARRPP